MIQNQNNSAVGDTVAPAQRQNAESLRCAVDQGRYIQANAAPKPRRVNKAVSFAGAAKNCSESNGGPGNCTQTLWFSFFFDGTGNNRDADVGTLKHSNVARLFRAMPLNNKDVGAYALYVPGVGTYCKEARDDGGGFKGYGFGDKGEERLKWASDFFDKSMTYHIGLACNQNNAIVEINIAAFGFSRGAALARAFVRRFAARCLQDDKGNWRSHGGEYITRK